MNVTSSAHSTAVLLNTDFPELQLHASGKVRDIYKVDHDHLLFVATDRISAFDYVLATGIPQKGRVLTQLSLFWFDFLKDIVPNHLVTADVAKYPAELQKYARPAARTLHAGGARQHGCHRVRGARLSVRFGLEGVQEPDGSVCGIKLACRVARIGQAAGADLYAGHQGEQRT